VPQTQFQNAQKEIEKRIYNQLEELGGQRFSGESHVGYHPGTDIKLPLKPKEMTKAEGAKLLASEAAAEEESTDQVYQFRYRPFDGAHAVQLTLQRLYGVSGRGLQQMTFFGPRPPQKLTIEVGLNKKVDVPWGLVELPMFDGTMMLDTWADPDYGELFQLTVNAPLKHKNAVLGFFRAVELTLESDSIYKGKAFVGSANPRFIDPYVVDWSKIVYNEDLEGLLNDTVWGVIENAEIIRSLGINLNKKVVFDGNFGSGKSVAGARTAQVALQKGWTFVQCETARDDIERTIRTAMLYQPAVVFIEDIEKAVEDKRDDKRINKMLELFDGISSKNNEVMVVMTSNHTSELPKGMLRAGRTDAIVHFPAPNRESVEKLIKVRHRPEELDPDIDYDRVYESVKEYEAAFITESFDKARISAVVRTKSKDFVLTTQDFIRGANLLRAQSDLHQGADEGAKVTTFDDHFRTMVRDELSRTRVDLHNQAELVEFNPEQ
jgi:transitional endoplasmic reticulum ATPase